MNGPPPVSYREPHSALNRPLLAYGLVAPAAAEITCLILGIVTNQPWFFVIMGWLLVPVMIWTSLLYRNWPTGVRFDAAAISIGAIGSARAAGRTPTVNHQSRGLFTCPWPAVEGVRIVTDRAELRRMKDSPRYYTLTNRWGGKRGMDYCNIGVLASPFMRAALLIDVDPAAVSTPQVRPARFYTNFTDGYFSRLVRPRLSPTDQGLPAGQDRADLPAGDVLDEVVPGGQRRAGRRQAAVYRVDVEVAGEQPDAQFPAQRPGQDGLTRERQPAHRDQSWHDGSLNENTPEACGTDAEARRPATKCGCRGCPERGKGLAGITTHPTGE
jgi:hypothetical protein